MEVEFVCRQCRKAACFETEETTATLTCSLCGKQYGPVSNFVDEKQSLLYCGVCGCRDLFAQKDFSRKVGLLIVAAGAILAPFTRLISLFVCALIDLVLYKVLPLITVCYRCHSIYREFALNPQHEGFNLGINDRYRAAERQNGF